MSKFLYKPTKSACQLKTIIFLIKFFNPVLQLLRLSHWRLDSSWPRLCAGNQIEKDWKWRRQHKEKSKTGIQRLRCGGFKRKQEQMWCRGGECEQQGLQLEQLCGWWCWSQCGCGNTLLKRGTSETSRQPSLSWNVVNLISPPPNPKSLSDICIHQRHFYCWHYYWCYTSIEYSKCH